MTLIKNKFNELPPNSIKPTGWLKNQLTIQANSLGGKLDEFWPPVKDSEWLGGDQDDLERALYWLDGLIPLAHLLDDKALKNKAKRYINYIVSKQDNGWLGPVPKNYAEHDMWSMFMALKVLIQYYECTSDKRIIETVEKCLRRVDSHLDVTTIANWGHYRWGEGLLAVFWLYRHLPEKWLLNLALKLKTQGFDWKSYFTYWPHEEKTGKDKWNFMGHVVNNAMAIKFYALWWQFSQLEEYREFSDLMMRKLDQYHGTVLGLFSGDECLAGKDPVQGTELCAVVEYMYSLHVLASIWGDSKYADRLEKIAFNALPATLSPDMWSHQYVQQVNQIECSIKDKRIWTTNGPDANIFGLEPFFGCCTANLSQGWPKFALNQWKKADEKTLVALTYAPGTLSTTVENVPVAIQLETDYPFREDLHFTINSEKPVNFTLQLRIPEWATEAEIEIAGETKEYPKAGTFHPVSRTWENTTRIVVRLPMKVKIINRPNNRVAVSRGPLIYSLKIDEEWKQVNQEMPLKELPHADWEVHPKSLWNYGLLENSYLTADKISVQKYPVGAVPFSPEGAPVSISIKGKQIPNWKIKDGSTGPLPEAADNGDQPIEELTLIPYGCTNLRMTEFPLVE